MDKYERATQKRKLKAFKCLDDFLLKDYGERCPDYEPMCIVCRVWLNYDQLQELTS